MAFLDNSGDIILDAVLTDTGRKRLARGDGSFKITKFALSDSEIDYTLYNPLHPSGSSYYDLEILNLPVFEAFTNNTSGANSNLITINRTNLLYLPVLKLNNLNTGCQQHTILGTHIVAVDHDTEDEFMVVSNVAQHGFLAGENILAGGGYISVHQGLDTLEVSPQFSLDSDLIETQYILKIDNRFGSIVSPVGVLANVSYVDDDNIASYTLTLGTDPDYVKSNPSHEVSAMQPISGPRGTYLNFKIKSSIDLNTSTFFFSTLGTHSLTAAAPPDILGNSGAGHSYYYIDTVVRVTGGTTGYTLDIPVRFVKFA
jgi:hypothetical protein